MISPIISFAGRGAWGRLMAIFPKRLEGWEAGRL